MSEWNETMLLSLSETGEGDYEANLVRLQEQLRRLDDIVRGVRPDRQSNKVISDPGHCSR